MPKKKTHCVGLGGLRVEHSNGDNDYVRTRYLSTEPGHYTPPEMMLLGKSEPKEVAPEPKKKKTTTSKQDAALAKAAKNDLNKRNLNNA